MQDPSNNPSTVSPDGSINSPHGMDNWEIVHGFLEQVLARDELAVPILPEVAIRVVRSKGSTDARQLSDIINADPVLPMYVLRVPASPATPPPNPPPSFHH